MFRRSIDNGPDFARLYVDPSCKNLIREMGLYRKKRDPQNPDGFLEQPEDKNNHACDALRYALVGRFGMGASTRHVASGR
jgi:phage terminase large subunit